ncbi:unnamed protein product, partial [Ceratitis capitata]
MNVNNFLPLDWMTTMTMATSNVDGRSQMRIAAIAALQAHFMAARTCKYRWRGEFFPFVREKRWQILQRKDKDNDNNQLKCPKPPLQCKATVKQILLKSLCLQQKQKQQNQQQPVDKRRELYCGWTCSMHVKFEEPTTHAE